MGRKLTKRVVAGIVSLAVFGTVLTWSWERDRQRARASEPNQTVSLGVSGLAAPSSPQDGELWSGDYVYYGSYEDEPIRWRVLDPTGGAGSSSEPGGILLQSDRVLAKMPFEDGEDRAGEHRSDAVSDNQWRVSDVRAWLQGSNAFLNSDHFSAREKAGIMRTTSDASDSEEASLQSIGLNSDTMFLLDVSDLQNGRYGYSMEDGIVNGGITGAWWLRCPHKKYGDGVGYVLSGGHLFHNFVYDDGGVVPAFNLDPSDVLFMTRAGEGKGELRAVETEAVNEWKLTLSEGETLRVAEVTRQEDEITVSYMYSGSDANQLSVMIADGELKDGANVKYYGKVTEDGEFGEGDTVTFTLPKQKEADEESDGDSETDEESGEEADGTFDEETDVVYLLAEQMNGGKQTDYASEPVRIELPPRHEHQLVWKFDEEAHWQECVAPGCDLTGEDAMIDYEEHDFGENEGVVIQEPTEEEDGIEEILCDICQNVIRQPIPYEEPEEPEESEEPDDDSDDPDDGSEEPDDPEEPEEHEFAEQIVRAATCTETGVKRIYCTDEDCGESREEVIPALSPTLTHTFGGWVQTVAPTTEREGVSRRTCQVCKAFETKGIPKLPPVHTHRFDEEVLTADERNHWSQCECGAKEEIEPHEWDQGKVLKKPTKKAMGLIRYECEICGKTSDRVVDKIGTQFSCGAYRYRVTGYKSGRLTAAVLGFVKGRSNKVVSIPKTTMFRAVRYTVTAVVDKAFAANLKVQKVVIPDTVEEIGNFAFFLAENTKSITLGTGMKEFGEHVFCHTYRLKAFTVKSRKLAAPPTGILHGGMEGVVIRVPQKRIEKYKRDVFYQYPDNVKGLKD